MRLLGYKSISLLIPWLLLATLRVAAVVAKTGRCVYTNIGRDLAADCRDLKLREVPGTLRTDIMALVLSENRIRKLSSLDRHSQLQLLYLDDNSIERLDVEALAALTSLRVLSVRLNSLKLVSSSLLTRLPSLKRLDLSENPSLDGTSLVSALTTWAEYGGGNLEELSVESCELRALPIPSSTPLPWLQVLNVSGNPLTTPVTLRLAPLCGLRRLALHGAPQMAIEFCECTQLRQWAAEGRIEVEPPQALKCQGRKGEAEARAAVVTEGGDGGSLEAIEAYCLKTNASMEAEALRQDCFRSVEAAEQRSAAIRLWASVGGSIGAVVVVVLLICCCCYLRRRQRRRRREAAARRCSNIKPPLVSNKDFDEDFPMKMAK